MLIKPRFAWSGSQERSVYEIVMMDGVIHAPEIFYIIRKIGNILTEPERDEFLDSDNCILPQNIMLNRTGQVRLLPQPMSLSLQRAYLPPEQNRMITARTNIYGLGMIMLFMATGAADKAKLDSLNEDRVLKQTIEGCIAFDPQMRFADVRALLAFMIREKRNFKKIWQILLLLLAIVGLSYSAFYFYQQGKRNGEISGKAEGYTQGYTLGYEKGFVDAPGIGIGDSPFDPHIGNLPGNIAAAQGAFAVRSEDKIFFIHQGNIYQMDPYTETIKLLVESAEAFHLSYFEGWLYYSASQKIFRLEPHSLKQEVFCDLRSGLLYIVDGDFYLDDLLEPGYLYKINADNGELRQLNDITELECLNIVGKRLYFTDKNKDYHLYSCELDGSNQKLLNSNSCQWFCVYDNKIYGYAASYQDHDRQKRNASASFFIRTDLEGGSIQKIGNTPASYINVTKGGIFYVGGQNRTLEWMSFDGRVHYTIVPSRTGPFNIAGRWIFYQNEEDAGHLWRVRIDGSDNQRVQP
ncbi:DUF5050 domain-containing protein [Clostridiales bacterium COT073_COT-073]|nr:DUF5050 domain-containing protein [Clostridiales bacterium COT073_COT-073]